METRDCERPLVEKTVSGRLLVVRARRNSLDLHEGVKGSKVSDLLHVSVLH